MFNPKPTNTSNLPKPPPARDITGGQKNLNETGTIFVKTYFFCCALWIVLGFIAVVLFDKNHYETVKDASYFLYFGITWGAMYYFALKNTNK